MSAPLVDRNTGDLIPASDHNDVKDYIEDGTYRVNTLSLSIAGVGEVITTSGKLTNLADVEITTGNKLILDGASGDSYLMYNNTTSKIELWVDGVKKASWG